MSARCPLLHTEERPYADPEAAARKLVELAANVEAVGLRRVRHGRRQDRKDGTEEMFFRRRRRATGAVRKICDEGLRHKRFLQDATHAGQVGRAILFWDH
ncbi:hypothetical protein CT676_37640 [Bradyrhizobium sp. MOS001]|uniref:Uncharacterized protein n=1 Tax=Bradyrhizobium japonicum TaxID=375 RepID=A0A1Y2JYV0_BRAJP|nr:hypothetical protein BSZ19_01510 [Bradyrhizobium japonicum]TFW56023.1 hypothetical protein CT676_37640 [Bradyrhizobium sp. MOS001]